MKQQVLEKDSVTTPVLWPGGELTFYATGSAAEFGGATVKLQSSADGQDWYDVDETGSAIVTFTEAGRGNARIGKGHIRAVAIGGDANTAVRVSAG